MKRGLYRMRPALKRVLWGGQRLQRLFAKDAPLTDKVGESWEVSALSGMESVDLDSGKLLSELWKADARHLGGHAHPTQFPLLVKFLNCEAQLSVQVHPDDAAAKRLRGASCGKREAWWILEAAPGAWIDFGFKPGTTAEDVRRHLANAPDGLEQLLMRRPVKAGEIWHVAPGTVHAPGPGIVMLEVQQPSDVTFRLHDWGRAEPGAGRRPLHIQEALEVLDYTPAMAPVAWVDASARTQVLLETPAFRLEARRIDGVCDALVRSLSVVVCLEGQGTVQAMKDSCALRPGSSVLLPAGASIARFEGENLLLAWIQPTQS
jgi:mannose-6-phosphate isomerase